MKFEQASIARRFTNSSKAGSDGKASANHDYVSAKPVHLADDEHSTKTEKTVDSNEQNSIPETYIEYPTFLTRIHVDTHDDTSFPKEVEKYKAKHIWEACKIGDEEVVRETIANSPDMIHRQEYGRTPLFLAAICGHIVITKLLLDAGARDVDGTAYACASGACRELLKEYPKESPKDPSKTSKFLSVFAAYKKTKKEEPDDREDEGPSRLHPLQKESLQRLQTISQQLLNDADLSLKEDDSFETDDDSSVSTFDQMDEISVSSSYSEYSNDTSQNDAWDFCGGAASADDVSKTEKIPYSGDEESYATETCGDTTQSTGSERNVECMAVSKTDKPMQVQGKQENPKHACWKQRIKALRSRRLKNTRAPMTLTLEKETEEVPATLKEASMRRSEDSPVNDFDQGTSRKEKETAYLKEGDKILIKGTDTMEAVPEEIITNKDGQTPKGDSTDTASQDSSGKNGFHRLKSHAKKKLIAPAALLLGSAAAGLSTSLARKGDKSKKCDMDDHASPNNTATVSEKAWCSDHENESVKDEEPGYPSDEEAAWKCLSVENSEDYEDEIEIDEDESENEEEIEIGEEDDESEIGEEDDENEIGEDDENENESEDESEIGEDDENENENDDVEYESIASDPWPRSLDMKILQRIESKAVAPEDEKENDDIAVAALSLVETGFESDAFEKMVAERSSKLIKDDQWPTGREGWPDEGDDSPDEQEFTEEEGTSGSYTDDSDGVEDDSDYVGDDSDIVGNDIDDEDDDDGDEEDDSNDEDDNNSDDEDEPFQYHKNPFQDIKSAMSELSFSLIREEIGMLFNKAENEEASDDE